MGIHGSLHQKKHRKEENTKKGCKARRLVLQILLGFARKIPIDSKIFGSAPIQLFLTAVALRVTLRFSLIQLECALKGQNSKMTNIPYFYLRQTIQ